jgi:phage tail sheath protein FI
VTDTEVAAEFTVKSKYNFASKASGNNIQLSFITSPGLVNDTTASFDIHDLVNGFVNVTINLQTDNNGAPPQFSIATVADIAAAIAAAAPVTYDSVEYDLSDIIEIVYPTAADANATFRPSVPALQINLSGGGVTAASGLITTSLHSGSNGTVSGDNVVDALQLFRDNVGNVLLFTENFRQEGSYVGTGQQTIDLEVASICHARQNCVGFLSAPLDVATASSNAAKKALCLAKFNTIGSSSYLAFDETPLYVYNRYADSYSWIPACGQQAGLCAWTAFVGEAWQSPAGLNRGQLLGVTKIAYNPNETDQADLYKARINCILSIPGEGIVLFGDKTALTKPSAFDRLNVRFLFIILRTDIARFARYQLFEFNDEFTRAIFRNAVEPYLRDVKGRRGLTDYKVVCDGNNNTEQVIDANGFVGDLYLKPTRSINFIQLNFIATRTGIEFNEIIGQTIA